LDANAAKANPAPQQPDSILRDALNALAAPASPVPDATLASTVAPVAAASDGRAVALPASAEAIASGGDTLLGRILTRATLAESSRTISVAEPSNSETGARRTTNVPANSGGNAPTAAAGTPAAALDAFLGAFASELARTDANGTRRGGEPAPAIAAGAALPATPSTQPAMAFAIPVANDAASVVPAPPASALPQPQHADANAVVDQLLRGMNIRTTDGQSEVRLRLVPESLGDVSVKLIVTGGTVNASITAHTADAQSALAGGATQLAKTLADAGLKLTSFTVGLAGGGFADARDQSRPNDAWTRPNPRRLGGVEAVDGDASDDPSLLAAPSFGPPIYTARTLPGGYNYLV
jgi:flagellar hook-length control protein FliK